MKKVLIVVLLVFTASTAFANPFVGRWQSTQKFGLADLVEFQFDEDMTYQSTMHIVFRLGDDVAQHETSTSGTYNYTDSVLVLYSEGQTEFVPFIWQDGDIIFIESMDQIKDCLRLTRKQ